MMNPMIAGYKNTDLLYKSSRSLIYYAERVEDNVPVAIKMLRDDYPSRQEVARFKHEYQIQKNLTNDITGVADVYGFEDFENKYIFIQQYVSGRDLASLRKQMQAFSLDFFFKISIQIAQALGEIHQHFIIHKDIKPQNILWDPLTESIKFIDFGIATELSREKQSHDTDLLSGSLPYISPEQTGRMNRSIDYRTDFYSLGITFYELLSGRLPFDVGNDSMSWVHCHIAKEPLPLSGIDATAIAAISAIIFKLMAKNAEDRYKSAFGLKNDLEICREQWQKTGAISQFTPGQHDISDRFEIPQKLYGREQEINRLIDTFTDISEGGSAMFLVGGYSGIGKSALINEVHKPIVAKHGYFISGKFDQYQRNIPYSAIAVAFQGLIKQLLAESTEQLDIWREKLLATLGPNGQVLIDMIPDLEQIIGPQPAVPHLGTEENQNRFNGIFQEFLQLFTRREHPLVLFIDDLQWVDSATLNLLKLFMNSERLNHFLLLGAFRDNEVDEHHPFIRMVEEIRGNGVKVPQLTLKSLDLEHVNQLIADTVYADIEETLPLSRLVMNKTAGNPFFVNHFLNSIYKNDLLRFDAQKEGWQWDYDQIEQLGSSDNVVDLMVSEMEKLPETTRELLRLGACIGNTFNLKSLAIISEQSLIKTAKELWPAVKIGLLFAEGEGHALLKNMDEETEICTEFSMTIERFQHDRVQQAAYSLIDDSQKQQIHLKIGRLLLHELLRETAVDDLENHYFDIVEHFNNSISLIEDDEELFQLAEINLKVGKKAKEATAYQPARQYFSYGIRYLENIRTDLASAPNKEPLYRIAFELKKGLVECYFLLSEVDAGLQQADALINDCHSIEDKVEVNNLLILYYGGAGKMDKAIDIALDSLRYFNVDLPRNPNMLQLLAELARVKIKLGNKSTRSLMAMPLFHDKDIDIVFSLLKELVAPTYLQGETNLLPYIILRMFYLTLKYGNGPVASFAYSGYALLWAKLDNFSEAHRFGMLAMEYNNKVNNPPMEARCYFMATSFALYWKQPLVNSQEPRKTGLQKLIDTGEYFWATYIYLFGFWQEVVLSKSIDDIFKITSREIKFSEKAKQIEPFYVHTLHQNLFKNLSGKSLNGSTQEGSLDADGGEESAAIKYFKSNVTSTMGRFYHVVCRLMLHYYYEDFKEAARIATQSEITDDVIRDGTFTRVVYVFFTCLSILAVASEMSSIPSGYRKAYKKFKKNLGSWNELCPENFSCMWNLLLAEECRVNEQSDQAITYFETAIQSARKIESLWLESLANEIYARFWLKKCNDKVASVYMSEASYLYYRWGAAGKVHDLEMRYPQLVHRSTNISSNYRDTFNTTETVIDSAHSQTSGLDSSLDIETLVKASQTLSGEIVMENLLGKLMQFLIENAGAQKGILILKKQQKLIVEAHISVHQEVVLQQEIPLDNADGLSIPLVRYVARSKKVVVLENACLDGQFNTDPYICKNEIKSVLCVPLIDKGNLIGILYLENNLVTNTFTPERVEVLKILSAEIAIALENARLYADLETYNQTLEEKVEERTHELNIMNEALVNKNVEIEQTKKIIEERNQHITNSIQYAQKIQQAILPVDEKILESLKQMFIIYKPKQIVSGDFYWYSKRGNKIMLAVADCTGHGVPGALLSMVGSMLLNKIINEEKIVDPAQVLDHLHKDMREELKQKGNVRQGNDGMDIGLCQIDFDTKKLIYAGARRPLYFVKNAAEKNVSKLIEIKGDRKSIVGRQKEDKIQFCNHELGINTGDMIYMTSDGYVDQHNIHNEKMGSLRLEAELEKIARDSMEIQKSHLLTMLDNYQKNETQRDDITIVGVKIS